MRHLVIIRNACAVAFGVTLPFHGFARRGFFNEPNKNYLFFLLKPQKHREEKRSTIICGNKSIFFKIIRCYDIMRQRFVDDAL